MFYFTYMYGLQILYDKLYYMKQSITTVLLLILHLLDAVHQS